MSSKNISTAFKMIKSILLVYKITTRNNNSFPLNLLKQIAVISSKTKKTIKKKSGKRLKSQLRNKVIKISFETVVMINASSDMFLLEEVIEKL